MNLLFEFFFQLFCKHKETRPSFFIGMKVCKRCNKEIIKIYS